jgi:hypothetical protein
MTKHSKDDSDYEDNLELEEMDDDILDDEVYSKE